MTESDNFLVELAYQMGFVPNEDADGGTFTDVQLVAFARRLIECTEKRVTERAVLVSDTGIRDDAVWLPKSQIEYIPEPKPGTIEVTLPEWLAVDKELI